jgi:probable HAF family extracellular repeat protein
MFSVKDLGTLGGQNTLAKDINNSGKVVGWSNTTADLGSHAFLYDGTMHDLGGSTAYGINSNGEIVGYWAADYVSHAFLYDGTMHDLGTLGGESAVAYGINDSGIVTGGSAIAGDNQSLRHAFLYDGTMHDLGTLGGLVSEGLCINKLGQVAGFSYLAGDNESHAFLYDGTMHDIGTLGGTNSEAFGINDRGQVVGHSTLYLNYDPYQAFMYDGEMHNLGTLPGGTTSQANDINNSGNVVGWTTFEVDGNSGLSAFFYDGVMHDLNEMIPADTGWTLVEATAINDSNQIIGYGMLNGQDRAFLLTQTSVPEPSSLALCGAVAIVAAFKSVRRRGRKQQPAVGDQTLAVIS